MLLRLIFLVLPFNLGYHFISVDSYISGVLVDYLIPTIYLQDIVSFVFNFWSFFLLAAGRRDFVTKKSSFLVHLTFLYLFTIMLTTLLYPNLHGVFYLLRSLNYWLTFVFISHIYTYEEISGALKYLYFSTIFILLLGLLQLLHQGSIFDNYLFFGEQPYNSFTKGLLRESLLGFDFIPPYSTFRHPNIFIGYLLVVVSILNSDYKYKKGIRNFYLAFLVIIKSFNAILAYAFQILSNLLSKKVYFFFLLLIFLFSFTFYLLPVTSKIEDNPSFYIRRDLVENAYFVAKQTKNNWFGLGIFQSLEKLDPFKNYYYGNRAVQPIHNVFLIHFVELGVFGFLFYLSIYIYSLFKFPKNPHAISMICIGVLSLFDHYFFTIHQTQLLFWLTIAFLLNYNYNVRKFK